MEHFSSFYTFLYALNLQPPDSARSGYLVGGLGGGGKAGGQVMLAGFSDSERSGGITGEFYSLLLFYLFD
jgi:hypothetical protein